MVITKKVLAAFEREMAGRQYGGAEQQDAWEWFDAGYRAALASQNTAPPAAVPAPELTVYAIDAAVRSVHIAGVHEAAVGENVRIDLRSAEQIAAAPAQAVDAPTVSESVVALIQQYGDQRADDDPRSPTTMGAVITAIRAALADRQQGGAA